MPRTPEFEPLVALEKAMEAFWEKGYFNTSIEDLVQYTGVSRKGLYNTFGNKRGMLLAALDHYGEMMREKMWSKLSKPDASLVDIKDFFGQFTDLYETREGKLGCFMCNTARELAVHDEEIRQDMLAHWDNMRLLFEQALKNAVNRKELPADLSPAKYANYFSGIMQGLANLARSGASRQSMEDYIEVALKVL